MLLNITIYYNGIPQSERDAFQKPAAGNILYEKIKYFPSEFLPIQKKRKQLYNQIPASDSSSTSHSPFVHKAFSCMCSKNVSV